MPLIILSSFVLLLGCSHLTIPNTFWYRDKGPLGARKVNSITGEAQDIGKEDWDEIRFGMFCASEDDFGKYQKFIEDACLKVKKCSIEQLREAFKILNQNLETLKKDGIDVTTY